jgi:hypothetical protein
LFPGLGPQKFFRHLQVPLVFIFARLQPVRLIGYRVSGPAASRALMYTTLNLFG